MYLKSLEMVGFKSFAAKTKLTFEPGMTAIVGPNGCGKSNISDAIRWVLGEQSAKAMRGSKMEDCIFTGTDTRKPMGMAEVNITFADCETALETEYDEVTLTRRVFRSGEGQYFINKTPCRLKDIHRLLMGTGIGTSSYSFMAQGRIDQILSARPEDRRAIFEEASGITKYKADKTEALRKLEQTEANLLRLADVIQEVKRQIGSLQRQAGKARRYKSMQEELRRMDIYTTRERLKTADRQIREFETKIAALSEKQAGLQVEVEETEAGNAVIRKSLMQTEREIATVLEAGVQAKSRLDHSREMITLNRQRIAEYELWTGRDSREINAIRDQIASKRTQLVELAASITQARTEHATTTHELQENNARLALHIEEIDATRKNTRQLREESIGVETLISRMQNQVVEIDSRERSAIIQHERLTSEQSQLKRAVATHTQRQQDTLSELAALKRDVEEQQNNLARLEQESAEQTVHAREVQEVLAKLQTQAAGKEAQIDILRESDAAGEGFADGSKLLLDPGNPLKLEADSLLGTLVSQLDVDDGYGLALEAALRDWVDAVVVKDAAVAVAILHAVQQRHAGAVRLVTPVAANATPTGPPAGDRLIAHVRVRPELQPLLQRLIGHVIVIDALDELPAALDPAVAFVTSAGMALHGGAAFELRSAESPIASPIMRKQAITRSETELRKLKEQITVLRDKTDKLGQDLEDRSARIRALSSALQSRERMLAQKEGENQVVCREAAQARERLETVTWELESLSREDNSGLTEKEEAVKQIAELCVQRAGIAKQIEESTTALHALESRHSALQSAATESRIQHASLAQRLTHMDNQQQALAANVTELEGAEQGRAGGIKNYQDSIGKLVVEIESAEAHLSSFSTAVTDNQAREASLRRNGEKQATELSAMESALARKREALDQLREARAKLDIERTENSVRRQNQADRITAEYNITLEDMAAEPDPDWEGAPPSRDAAETRVAELRARMEAIGPINLVAIEEYKELEERFAFLTAQEEDLVKSKQQLMDMIRKINRTTTEMFSSTFAQVNTNFELMFKKLFNGGTAKLLLVDEEDVLDCGIEIIARPTGKRLQNVSLLSGGERTLTAVALLFAIYMIKPSPFCLLDELDAALDDSNILRFVGVLQGFLSQSQFVVITHNRQTIAAASILYGVTMPERGISRIVSMRFNEAGKPGSDPAVAETEAATIPDQ